MTDTILRARRALSLLAMAGLAACGGGGGGGDSGSPPAADLLAISDANADAVARAGLAGAGVGPLAGGLGTGLGASGAAGSDVAQARRRATTLALKVAARARPMDARTVDCAVSGSVTVELTGGNDLLDAPGESLRIAASQCNDGDGQVLNGSYTMTLTAFTNGINFSFTMAFAGLSVQSSEDSAALDGTLAVRFTGGNTLDISADSFALRAQQSGSSYSFSLSDFSTRVIDSGDALVQRVAGRLAGSGLSTYGVDVSTPVDVVQRYADDYPSAGTMRFVGAAGSALKVDALSATQARLSIDADGDGTYEKVRTVAWSTLD